MVRDIHHIEEALDSVSRGDQDGVYVLLAKYNQTLKKALERGGQSRLISVRKEYVDTVVDFLEAAGADTETQGEIACELIEAYPPIGDDHQLDVVLTNFVARTVVRTRVKQSVEAIPVALLEYLATINTDDGGDIWNDAGLLAWGAGHPEFDVNSHVRSLMAAEEDIKASAVVEAALYADPETGIELLDTAFQAADHMIEDTVYVSSVSNALKYDLPRRPWKWDMCSDLDLPRNPYPEDFTPRVLDVLDEHLTDGDVMRLSHGETTDVARMVRMH